MTATNNFISENYSGQSLANQSTLSTSSTTPNGLSTTQLKSTTTTVRHSAAAKPHGMKQSDFNAIVGLPVPLLKSLPARLEAVKNITAQSFFDKTNLKKLLAGGGRQLFYSWLCDLEKNLQADTTNILQQGGVRGSVLQLVSGVVKILDHATWTTESIDECRFDKILRRLYKIFDGTKSDEDIYTKEVAALIKEVWSKYRSLQKGIIPEISGGLLVKSESSRSLSSSSVAGSQKSPSTKPPAAPSSTANHSTINGVITTNVHRTNITNQSSPAHTSLVQAHVSGLLNTAGRANVAPKAAAVSMYNDTQHSVSAPVVSVSSSQAVSAAVVDSAISTVPVSSPQVARNSNAPILAKPVSLVPPGVQAPPVSNGSTVSGSGISASSRLTASAAPVVPKAATVPSVMPTALVAPTAATIPSVLVTTSIASTIGVNFVSAPQAAPVITQPPITALPVAPTPTLSTEIATLSSVDLLLSKVRECEGKGHNELLTAVLALQSRMEKQPFDFPSFLSSGGRDTLYDWLLPYSEKDVALPQSEDEVEVYVKLVHGFVRLLDQAVWTSEELAVKRFDKVLQRLYKKYQLTTSSSSATLCSLLRNTWEKYRKLFINSSTKGKGKENGRIVNHSSGAHQYTSPEFYAMTDLQLEKSYDAWTAYGNSKAANLMFTYELNKRLSHAKDPRDIVVVAVHPGYTNTNLQTGRFPMHEHLNNLFAMDGDDGALAQFQAAVDPSIPASFHDYLGPKYFMFGTPALTSTNGKTWGVVAMKKLWEESVRLTGADFGGV
eukprot:gene25095-31510_t